LSGLVQPAHAADFPTRPIRVILPFPAGGGADATARLVAQKLSEALKQPVVIDNRPGANGLIGTDAVAKAAPDGYTMLFTDRGALGINPSLYKTLPYDPTRDFEYVGIVAWGPYVLVAHPSVPVKTFAELVDYAKKNPGKLNYASFGIGSMPQMGMESLNSRYGMNIRHVPYKGGAPATTATLAGEVDVTLATLGNITGSLKEGRLKALVIGSSERSPLLPQVPTIVEAGGNEDTIPGTYFGFALPAHTPKAIVTQLSTEIRRIVAMPDVVERLVSSGFQSGKATPEDMAAIVRRDVVQFARLSAAIGIKPE
jgi:tripartite-type tricarboxylate transporter receptor subunit TctC